MGSYTAAGSDLPVNKRSSSGLMEEESISQIGAISAARTGTDRESVIITAIRDERNFFMPF